MRPDETIRALARHGGVSLYSVSEQLGRSRSWAGMVAGRPGVALGTVADVADVAGVDVVLRDRATGEDLGTIEPPRRSRQGERGDAAQVEPSD